MSDRYNIAPAEETGEAANTGTLSFPYTFPFFFHRLEVRFGDDHSDTWTSAIAKTGRFGMSPL